MLFGVPFIAGLSHRSRVMFRCRPIFVCLTDPDRRRNDGPTFTRHAVRIKPRSLVALVLRSRGHCLRPTPFAFGKPGPQAVSVLA